MMNMLKSLLFLFALSPALTLAATTLYWVDSDGQVVRDGMGNCIRALYHGRDFPACRGEVVAKAPSDSDRDGVIDERDQCPGTPANVAVDAVGCPRDNDRDGVANYLDKCPNTPRDSVVDEKGCPLKIVVRDLNFSNDSSALRPASITTLEGVVAGIKDNPSITQVTVTGHTDSSASEEYNKALSERRAAAVADYLRGRLGNVQIISAGMGETNPVASNATREGRAQNRRVEIDLK